MSESKVPYQKMIAISPQIAKDLKKCAALKETTIKEIVETLAIEYLKKEGYMND